MAITPRSFLRNPLLLALLLGLALPAAAFWAYSSTTCPKAKRQVKKAPSVPHVVQLEAQTTAANVAVKRVEKAKKSKAVAKKRRGWLGVRIQTLTPKRAKAMGADPTLRGVRILNVQPGQPAERSGFQRHDVVTHFNGKPVRTHCQLSKMVGKTAPGTKVKVRVIRDGVPVVLLPTLGNAKKCGCDADKKKKLERLKRK